MRTYVYIIFALAFIVLAANFRITEGAGPQY